MSLKAGTQTTVGEVPDALSSDTQTLGGSDQPQSSKKTSLTFLWCYISPQIARSFSNVCLIVHRVKCVKSLTVQIGSRLHKAAAGPTQISQVMI